MIALEDYIVIIILTDNLILAINWHDKWQSIIELGVIKITRKKNVVTVACVRKVPVLV